MDTDSHGFNLGPPRIDTDAHGSLFAGGTNLDHTPQSAIGTLQCKSSICNRQSPMNVGHGWTRIHTASIWGRHGSTRMHTALSSPEGRIWITRRSLQSALCNVNLQSAIANRQ